MSDRQLIKHLNVIIDAQRLTIQQLITVNQSLVDMKTLKTVPNQKMQTINWKTRL
jgi:hypothetical protein